MKRLHRRGPIAGLFTRQYLTQMLEERRSYVLARKLNNFAKSLQTTTYELSPAQIMEFLFQERLKQARDIQFGRRSKENGQY